MPVTCIGRGQKPRRNAPEIRTGALKLSCAVVVGHRDPFLALESRLNKLKVDDDDTRKQQHRHHRSQRIPAAKCKRMQTRAALRAKYPGAQCEVGLLQIGCTIAVHTGPYALGMGVMRRWKKQG